jgi:hypothetical protein
MTSLNEARLSQVDEGHAGLLSETARSAGGGPLRLMLATMVAAGLVTGAGLMMSDRLLPWAGRMIGQAEALLGRTDANNATMPKATASLSGPLTLLALSPADLMQQYPPVAGQSLTEGSFTRPAWQRFQRPAVAAGAGQAQLAILVSGLGLNKALTAAAILYLPPDVSLSFSPYAPDLAAWLAAARAHGHEVLVDLPMESAAPQDDPGTDGLRTGLKPSENNARLARILDRAPQVAGVATALGSRFLTDRGALAPVLADLAERGLGVIEASPDPRLLTGELGAVSRQPYAKVSIAIDDAQGRDAILANLAALGKAALTRDAAAPMPLAVISPSPLSLALIVSWSQQISGQGLALTPATNILGR